MNTEWWEIDIHGCYSLVNIAFAPICACKNNRRIWRHNINTSRARDVTDQLRWRHNAKPEKIFLGDNGKMNDRCSGHKTACKKKYSTFVTVNNDFFRSLMLWFANDFHSWLRHSWKSLANQLTRDRKIVIHGNSWIIHYIITVGADCVAKLFHATRKNATYAGRGLIGQQHK